MKKNGVSNSGPKADHTATRTKSRSAERTTEIQPPKKNGPTM